MKLYQLTLILTEEQMEERLQNEFDRKLTKAAIAAEGAGILRDFGAVSSFVKVARVIL